MCGECPLGMLRRWADGGREYNCSMEIERALVILLQLTSTWTEAIRPFEMVDSFSHFDCLQAFAVIFAMNSLRNETN